MNSVYRNFILFLLITTTANAQQSTPTWTESTTGVQVTSRLTSDKTGVELTMTIPSQIGWFGIGMGTGMNGADIAVVWATPSTRKIVLSRKQGLSSGVSNAFQQDLILLPDSTVHSDQSMNVHFVWPLSSMTQIQENLIWAAGQQAPESDQPTTLPTFHGPTRGKLQSNLFTEIQRESTASSSNSGSATPSTPTTPSVSGSNNRNNTNSVTSNRRIEILRLSPNVTLNEAPNNNRNGTNGASANNDKPNGTSSLSGTSGGNDKKNGHEDDSSSSSILHHRKGLSQSVLSFSLIMSCLISFI